MNLIRVFINFWLDAVKIFKDIKLLKLPQNIILAIKERLFRSKNLVTVFELY